MKIIIFVLILNGILVILCNNESINLSYECEIKDSDGLFCSNLNLTNYGEDIQFIYGGVDNLLSLTFENCIIPNYFPNLIDKFNDLHKVSLINCKIENFEQYAFDKLYYLRQIIIENSFIKKLKSFTFSGESRKFDYLILYLINNKIENIEEYCFKNEYISYINLESNQLTTIKKKMFAGATSLYRLDLSNNLIEGIEEDSFLDQEKLSYLYLNHNKLIDIQKNTFNGLNDLRELNLSFNLIKFIDGSAFQNTINLKNLFLDHNNLKQIEKNTFSNLKYLEQIRLNHNKIENIEKDSFLNASRLVKLFLNNNKLKSFNDTELGYKSSKQDNIHIEEGTGIDLSMNSLESVYFGYPHTIEILNLSSNNIKNLHYDTFKGLNLDTLILSNNKIEKFDTHVIYPLNNLSTFYIDGNKISDFDYEDPKFRLSKINLSYNNWNCIYLENMIKFLNKHNITYIVDKKPNTTQNVAGIGCTENDQQQNVLGNPTNSGYVEKFNKNFQNVSNKLKNEEIIHKTSSVTAPYAPYLIVIIVLFCILIISLNIWICVFYRNQLQIRGQKKSTEIH